MGRNGVFCIRVGWFRLRWRSGNYRRIGNVRREEKGKVYPDFSFAFRNVCMNNSINRSSTLHRSAWPYPVFPRFGFIRTIHNAIPERRAAAVTEGGSQVKEVAIKALAASPVKQKLVQALVSG